MLLISIDGMHAKDLVHCVPSGSKKIAEHGGGSTDDTNVMMLVSGPGVGAPSTYKGTVRTTQIAPSILCTLGLDPRELQAVRREGTTILPGLSCRIDD